jgi:hypothetical protein
MWVARLIRRGTSRKHFVFSLTKNRNTKSEMHYARAPCSQAVADFSKIPRNNFNGQIDRVQVVAAS